MYKGQAGMWSWLFHRITGLGLVLFLIIHIVDISLLSFGPSIYNDGIKIFDSVIARFLSLFVVAAVFYHGFNGLRIMLVDFWRKAPRYQKQMFAVVMVATIIAFVPMAYFVLLPVLNQYIWPMFAWLFYIPA